ncbi:MAG: transglycosylase domain-containing protein, partial [Treponema sp.]|nr:transglycosylase domain-containing protein [Treponema sp.]
MKIDVSRFKTISRVAIIIVAVLALLWLILRFSPYPELRQFHSRPYSVRFYDRYGMLLQVTPLAEGLRRERSYQIPQQVKDVFVFSEDRRFFRHPGVDILALFRALTQNISSGRVVSGASTITMQLARIIADNAHDVEIQGVRRQTAGSKIVEMFNALRLETRFSKDEILRMYLESLPFGFSTEGVTSAARTFFASEISMLSGAQLFCLAVIPRRPSFFNPLDNPQNSAAAAMALHSRFADNRRLSERWPLLVQLDERDFQFAISSVRRFQYPFELPHLIRLINTQLLSEGNPPFEVHLSINLALQRFLENEIAGNVARFYMSRITNGSGLVIDNATGEILAWVGSADFFNESSAGQIDGVLVHNQPGSAMKQFLFAMALENGFYPSDVIADVPMTFGQTEVYFPQNFNNRFNGPVLFRTALAASLNIPSVYLLYRLSVRGFTEHLLALGFDSIEHTAHDAGLGLALGNAPVSLLELVRAFSVFPRDGIYLPVTWHITDGSQVYDLGKRIYSVDTARIICSFLSDASARVLAFGAGRNFRTTFPSMFKTGTANQFQDIVALGATMRYSVGVWMGNFTGEAVMDRTGSSLPAAIARNTLNVLHGASDHSRGRFVNSFANNHTLDFPQPVNWRLSRICAVSGMEPGEGCLSIINEFIHPDEERFLCTWHVLVNNRSETIFPAEYQAWFNAFVRQGALHFGSRPLEIINPREGFVYLSNHNLGLYEIPVEVIGGQHDIL